jgi:hypothetical protein
MSRSTYELRKRRQDPDEVVAKSIYEVYDRISEDEAVKYAIGAMQPIDPDYTANTYKECDRVQNQISTGLDRAGLGAEFRHQGSVETNTHIRAHSDIDLLVIEERFYSLEPPLRPTSPYTGDVLRELAQLRGVCERTLISAFPEADVDVSGGKAIAISGGSLRRKVDVVVSNWWDTVDYNNSRQEWQRGVHILDQHVPKRIPNRPFEHIKLLNDKDAATSGCLRKAIRLLKSLKYDSDGSVTISSYDIAALGYAIPAENLFIPSGYDLRIVDVIFDFLNTMVERPYVLETLEVPNRTRRIISDGGATLTQVRALRDEVVSLRRDIELGLSRSLKKLTEARVEY